MDTNVDPEPTNIAHPECAGCGQGLFDDYPVDGEVGCIECAGTGSVPPVCDRCDAANAYQSGQVQCGRCDGFGFERAPRMLRSLAESLARSRARAPGGAWSDGYRAGLDAGVRYWTEELDRCSGCLRLLNEANRSRSAAGTRCVTCTLQACLDDVEEATPSAWDPEVPAEKVRKLDGAETMRLAAKVANGE